MKAIKASLGHFAKCTLHVVAILVILQIYLDPVPWFRGTAIALAQTSPTFILDTNFDAADWSVQERIESGASQTNKQETSGGNPNAFRSMVHTLPRPASPNLATVEVTHIFAGQSYNPSVQGPIDKIDYSEDIILLNTPWPQAFVISYLIIKQDETIYRSTGFVSTNSNSWETHTLTNLTADDFSSRDGLESRPDFSAAGGPIEFGFWRFSIRTNDSPVAEDRAIIVEHGIDNFTVSIHPPAPVNRPPIARDDVYVVAPEELDLGLFLDVTVNDRDPDGDRLVISAVRPAGEASIYQQTGVSYRFSIDGPQEVTLSYTVTDGEFFDEAEVILLKDCACFTSCATLAKIVGRSETQEDLVDLDLLYRVRDELLKPSRDGARYVDIYYNSTPELLKVLLIDRPDLGARAVAMVEMVQPALRSLLEGDGAVLITQAQMDTVASVFADLALAGTDSLQQVVSAELDRLGELDAYVGKPVAEVMGTVLGESSFTAIDQYSATEPDDFVLQQNFPNPFNSGTVIRFALPQSEHITLSIYDLVGQRLATLVDGLHQAGTYTVGWNGRDDQGRALASGVYLYRLQAGPQQVETHKLLLLR